ncbi:hypothetical protein Tco_1367760 [Tanacetum coccineum]
MGDENPIRTLRDYSKPSHECYRNTIELLVGKNMVPLRSDTIRLVQNGCSFHRLRSEDPKKQPFKDFSFKLVDLIEVKVEKRERNGAMRPSPQPQALGTTFEARLWDYMVAHTERMERFENSIFKASIKVKEFQRSFRHSDTERLSRSDEVLKLKNFKKDATLKLSKSTNQEWYEHVGPEVTRSQDDKVTRWQNEIMLG